MFIKKLSVEKFKSFKNKTEIELRGLTILSGANSSGKSSIMQPLLLLKQTLHAGFDPGPLLISGPNVVFAEIDQMIWATSDESKSDFFKFGLEVHRQKKEVAVELFLKRQKDGPTPLKISECTWMINKKRFSLNEAMTNEAIKSLDVFSEEGFDEFKNTFSNTIKYSRAENVSENEIKLIIRRMQIFPVIFIKIPGTSHPIFPDLERIGMINGALRNVIHVPGLRGNPRRTYPVTAVENEFPGLFQDYVASIIAAWQKNDEARLASLGKNLLRLGLTWKVQARQKSDSEVELVVGRLSNEKITGLSDMVSIADVGFGISQSLPVVVALLTVLPGQLVYIEQPEIHLHPRAQVALAELIVDAVEVGAQVVIETHSELLLLGIQKLVAQGKIKKDNVLLHWFERDNHGVSHVTTVEFDEQGAPGKAPIDFSDVSMDAMRQYLDATVTSKR